MTPFETFVYSALDVFVSSEVGLAVFLLGGFTACIICTILICTPLFREIPLRLFLIFGSAIPVIVAIYGTTCSLFVKGRQVGIMLALSPAILAFIPTLTSLVFTISNRPQARRVRFIGMHICLFLAQIWATLVIWLATNYGFMGASC